ncbi:MAG: radical SAM family heme chaperone HemW [Prevotella sp.]
MTSETLTYDMLGITLDDVFNEMGCKGTCPADSIGDEVKAIVSDVRQWVRPRYVFTVMRGETDTAHKTLRLTPRPGDDGVEFECGGIVSRQLREGEAYAIFVCTAGAEYQRFIERLSAEGDMVRVFIVNALGSVIAESTADYMERVLQEQIDKLGWHRTNRFSPGYCGWHVSEQQKLFPLFNGSTAGVRLTDSSLMMPIKSVSGVIGLGHKVRYLEYSCGLCDYKDCYKRRARRPNDRLAAADNAAAHTSGAAGGLSSGGRCTPTPDTPHANAAQPESGGNIGRGTGLYIHFPFCSSRCIYCGFYSTTQLSRRDEYAEAIVRELHMRAGTMFARPRTIYFGGGTPSVLTTQQLSRVIDGVAGAVDISNVEEWTMECNPDDITEDMARWIAASPINRVSMGIQTFSDKRLAWLRRRHDSRQASQAVAWLREAGVVNISIDLMFGFPGETIDEWNADITKALDMRPEHISAYSLMYEEGTPMYQMRERGDIGETDEETYAAMYDTLTKRLVEAGYVHYEISNFCLPGYESMHNSSYWDATPYIGIGAAAHSYSGDRRWWNVSCLDTYLKKMSEGQLPTDGEEAIGATTRYNDTVTTALRTKRGIRLGCLDDNHRTYILHQAQRYIESGKMAVDDGWLHLTYNGILTSDNIMADLIWLDE